VSGIFADCYYRDTSIPHNIKQSTDAALRKLEIKSNVGDVPIEEFTPQRFSYSVLAPPPPVSCDQTPDQTPDYTPYSFFIRGLMAACTYFKHKRT